MLKIIAIYELQITNFFRHASLVTIFYFVTLLPAYILIEHPLYTPYTSTEQPLYNPYSAIEQPLYKMQISAECVRTPMTGSPLSNKPD